MVYIHVEMEQDIHLITFKKVFVDDENNEFYHKYNVERVSIEYELFIDETNSPHQLFFS